MRRTRGLTIIEMLVVSALMAIALVAVLRAISASTNLENRSEVTLRLSLLANAEMERVKTLRYEELTEGTRALEKLSNPNDQGQVTIRSLNNGNMKEITITMTHTTAKGFQPVQLVTMIAKPMGEES